MSLDTLKENIKKWLNAEIKFDKVFDIVKAMVNLNKTFDSANALRIFITNQIHLPHEKEIYNFLRYVYLSHERKEARFNALILIANDYIKEFIDDIFKHVIDKEHDEEMLLYAIEKRREHLKLNSFSGNKEKQKMEEWTIKQRLSREKPFMAWS